VSRLNDLAQASAAVPAAGRLYDGLARPPAPNFGSTYGWPVEHQVDLGSSDGPATHALFVDAESNTAWVMPIALAYRAVRQQSLEPEPRPSGSGNGQGHIRHAGAHQS
jgi:hypothetical protein